MAKIDNIISIIMVFVTAIGFARATSMSPVMTVITVIAAFILYELILNVANGNPSIRTMLFVTNGFIFGLSLTVILDFDISWLSAVICLLCMGYKYMVAEATSRGRSYSRNIFVIVVNAFFYSCMFTVVECMAFREMTTLFVMIYVVSFAFFMCSYISVRRAQPVRRKYPAGGGRGAFRQEPADHRDGSAYAGGICPVSEGYRGGGYHGSLLRRSGGSADNGGI